MPAQPASVKAVLERRTCFDKFGAQEAALPGFQQLKALSIRNSS